MTEAASSPERSWVWNTGLLIAGFFVCWVLSTPGTTRTEAVTRLSALLQLAGIIVVAWGIADLRREVGLPTLWAEIRSDVVAFVDQLRGKRSGTVVITGGASFGASGGRARVTVGLPPNATTEQMFEHLQRQVDGLFEATGHLEDRADREKQEREDAVKALRSESEQRYTELWNKVRNIATGGIRLESVGLVWLTAGTILAGFGAPLSYLFWRRG